MFTVACAVLLALDALTACEGYKKSLAEAWMHSCTQHILVCLEYGWGWIANYPAPPVFL